MKYFGFILSLALCLTASSFAADDPAKGHYDSAIFFMENGKLQQAVDDLNFIVKSFPQSAYADDALFQLGVYYFNQEKDLDQALSFFQQIKDRYTNSNAAPGAYYYIGQIFLTRRRTADLDEAYANFERVPRIFPSSEWVDKSLVGAGHALKGRGEYDKAYEEFAKVKIRYPNSPLAPEAQFEMGLASIYAEDYKQAVIDFQKVIDRYPNSPLAREALLKNSMLYRLYISTADAKALYKPDPAYAGGLTDLDEPTGLFVDSKQNLHLSDKGKKTVFQFSPQGRLLSTTPAHSPQAIFVTVQDRVIIANAANLLLPGRDPLMLSVTKEGKPQTVEEIRSVATNQFGDMYVVSNNFPGILVFDQNGKWISGSPFSKAERQYSKVFVSARNNVYALDKEKRQISVYSPEGKLAFTFGPSGKGFGYDRVEDFAVDGTNHIYVLTKGPRGVLIFSPTGTLLKYLPSEKASSISFEEGKNIAVGSTGEIYVLDKETKRIIKLG